MTWLFIFVWLAQPLAAVNIGASQARIDRSSKWHEASTPANELAAPLIEGRPDAALLPAWERFQQAALDDLQVFWHRHAGTPETIYGLMVDVSGKMDDPASAAQDFLAQEAGLFKIRSMSDLQLVKLSESVTGYHVFWQQTYQGIPVHGGMLGVHIDPTGRIHALANSYVPDVFVATLRPSVSSEQVYQQMLAELGANADRISLFDDPQQVLVIYVAADSAHLAWQITIPAREPLGTWEAFWDAQTGERISPLVDRNYYADGTGRAFIPNAVVATGIETLRDQFDSASAVPDSAYSTVTLLGLDGSGFLNGPFVNTRLTRSRVQRSNLDFSDLDRSDGGFEEVEAYWAIDAAQRYIQSFEIFGAGNYSLEVDAHGLVEDNSFYASRGNGTGLLRFGDGGVDDAEDAEIVWHEYGHALLDNQVPNINQNFDGMGEGFGDYWAATMSTLFPSANRARYDPAVGEWDATSYRPANANNPPLLRRVDTNAHYPEDRSGDPHVTGMIWSRALWDIHNSVGRETADEIILEGNFLMPFNPTLPQAAQALLQAERNLTGGAHNQAVTTAFAARGLVRASGSSVTVQSPNGGEVWPVGSVQAITWQSTGISGNVNIQLSRDGGVSFVNLFNNVSNMGTVKWTVTGPATVQARVRISSVNDSSVSDTSNSPFTISATALRNIHRRVAPRWSLIDGLP
jgi:Zn-dependent metalloprotease